jgi:hypothetical protein
MPTRKRHHYAPRPYLSRFADDDGLLWQYERGKAEPVQVQPGDAAVEGYLYAPEVGEDPKNDAVETFLADFVDGPAVEPLERLIAGRDLTVEDRTRLSLYIAFQEFRVPERRDWVLGIVEKMAGQIMDLVTSRPAAFRAELARVTGREHSEEEVEQLIRGHREGRFEIKATKVTWLQCLVGVSQDLVPTIARLKWLVVEVGADKDFEFVTSDAPVTKVLTDRSVPGIFAGGWESPSAESTLTLSPKHVLTMTTWGMAGRLSAQGAAFSKAKRWLKDINARTVGQAQRFAFSRRRQDFIPKVFARRGRR